MNKYIYEKVLGEEITLYEIAMKKPKIIYILIALSILGFMIWVSWRNEAKKPMPVIVPEKIEIKQPAQIEAVPYDTQFDSKG